MKLDPNHIDELFGQRLRNTEAPPPAFVWTNVERELRKRRRRYFFFWLFAFGVAGAGLWIGISKTQSDSPIAAAQRVFSKINKKSDRAGNPERQIASDVSPAPESSGHVEKDFSSNLVSSKTGFTAKNAKAKPLKPINYAPMCVDDSKIRPKTPLLVFEAPTPIDVLQTDGLNTPLAFSRKETLPQAQTKLFIRKKKDPKYCYDFAQNPNVWLIDAYAGPSFNQRTLEASNPSFEPYRQMRLATERQDWAFHAGLRGSLLFGRHFLLRTGVHYEHKTEVFEYADPNYIEYLVKIRHITEGNQVITIIDTIGVDYGESYTKTYNRYGLLDIPLEVGGEIRWGRIGLSANAGISLNVLFWKRGDILSQGGHPAAFTPNGQGATEVFRPRTGLSAGGSAQVFVHLQPRLRVFAEPYFRQILKPVTLAGQPVQQRYGTMGVKFGLTKILD